MTAMSGFEYGNARLRAMRSKLLSRQKLEEISEADSRADLMNRLAQTSYRQALEMAVTRAGELESISYALHWDWVETIRRIRRFFDGKEGDLAQIALRAYDIHNVKTILRGTLGRRKSVEMMDMLFPVGGIPDQALKDLSQAGSLRAALDLMLTLQLPFARPLAELLAERPAADLFEMELALDRWHYAEADGKRQQMQNGGKALADSLDLEADLSNLLSAVRFTGRREELDLLRQKMGGALARVFVGPGHLPFDLLERIMTAGSLKETPPLLQGSPYHEAFEMGVRDAEKDGRLSALERRLRRCRDEKLAGMIAKDPLGIGVLLGYLTLKRIEIDNLRWIAHGVNMGLSRERIRAEMEFIG